MAKARMNLKRLMGEQFGTMAPIAASLHERIPIDKLHVYERNPRKSTHPRYASLKASIQKTGLCGSLIVTQREGEDAYVPALGQNTRLTIFKELYAAGDARFAEVHCHIVKIGPESELLVAHYGENVNRADLTFFEEAQFLLELQELLEDERGGEVSQVDTLRYVEDQCSHRVDEGTFSRMRWAVEELNVHLPLALEHGLSGKDVRRLRKLHTDYINGFGAVLANSTEETWHAALASVDKAELTPEEVEQSLITHLDAVQDASPEVVAELLKLKRVRSVPSTPVEGAGSQPATTSKDGTQPTGPVRPGIRALRVAILAQANKLAASRGFSDLILSVEDGYGFLVKDLLPVALCENSLNCGLWWLLVGVTDQFADPAIPRGNLDTPLRVLWTEGGLDALRTGVPDPSVALTASFYSELSPQQWRSLRTMIETARALQAEKERRKRALWQPVGVSTDSTPID